MKKSILLLALPFLFYACSSSVDVANMSEEERLAYAMSLYNDEEYLDALTEFQGILLQFPGSQSVDDAQYYLGLTHFKRSEYILSAYEFSKLIKDMPASDFVPEAQYMLAESYYQLSPSYHLDQRYTKKGIEEFQAFIDFFPSNERVPEAEAKIKEMNNKLAKKLYEAARIYEKMEYNAAAVEYYQEIENVYHDTQFAPMASYRKIKVLLLDEKKKEAAKEAALFLARYPNDPNAAEVKSIEQTLGGV
jgi:outer membrane protein assembly factor BamD